jgi:hypothetical protein
METYEQRAEYVEPQDNQQQFPVDYRDYPQPMVQGQEQYEEAEMFQRPNDLRVIQEYNREENMPQLAKKDFWALASKSVKLGFWKEEDYKEIFLHKNLIKVGHIMSNPRHSYNFQDRQLMNQMDFLVYSDFKRGVGMEKYKLNERTLQATSVQQHIQGSGGPGGKQGGIFSGLKSFFG